jgi:hypothetical protein
MNETLLLAKLMLATSSIHDESWVPTRYVTTPEGDRVQGSGGYYKISWPDAVGRAAIRVANGNQEALFKLMELTGPAVLMTSYIGEAIEWATLYIKAQEKPDPVSADIAALSEANAHAADADEKFMM